MCASCGCGSHEHHHEHDHDHEHPHDHHHEHQARARTLRLELELLARNDASAAELRGWLGERGIVALNLIGAPGAGKTSLLEETIRRLPGLPVAVLEGDQETDADAARIRAAGGRSLQINTGTGCHLDADMIARALRELAPEPRSLLLVENVGNLVCPALFDLGERCKVVVASVTEGEDKPLKYPHVFRAAEVLVLTKADLLPHVRFDADRFVANARHVNPKLQPFVVSATTGEGLDGWCAWLRSELGR